ncbi:MAG: PKD domain-containing protein, partial [Saprospiraceae bacterium]|nr:PKD domain-containing protein [Saprospiraceae bacterium]
MKKIDAMAKVGFTLLSFLFSLQLFAQLPVFEGKQLKTDAHALLQTYFYDYEVVEIDMVAFDQYVKSVNDYRPFQLKIEGLLNWAVEIYPHDLRSPDYLLRVAGEKGVQTMAVSENKTYRGNRIGLPDDRVSLTIDHDFLYGYIEAGKETYFIEPLWYFDGTAPKDRFVLYKDSKVIPHQEAACGAQELSQKMEEVKSQAGQQKVNGLCYEIDLAIASDGLMFNKYGSVTAVENHNIAVMNNVQTNYDNEFDDELQYIIVEQFVSTSTGADPWTANTDAGVLLNSFTNWGPNGFSATHDLGQLWTNRNFDGPTIGIAWLSSVCDFDRYHCLQDFSSNASLLRVLTSHEIGHNLSATHDASGSNTIMAPSVNNTNTWSNQSLNQINNHYQSNTAPGGCLSQCVPPVPPIPLFTSNLNVLCTGSRVTFYDQSLNDPTSWNWSFPGGTPSTSTQQNPTITYNTPGVYGVTLTATNGNGSSTNTLQGFITVGPAGTDFFFYQNFESGNGGFTMVNPDNQTTWTNTMVGGSREGTRAMLLNNFTYNATGQRDGLVSPTLDFYGRSNVRLELDYAYARYSATRRDSLIIYVSTNDGQTFPFRVFAATENGSGNFATHPETTTAFDPNELSDWCYAGTFGNDCLNVDLSAFDGMQNIKIKIENYNGHGNKMWVDNFRLFSDCKVVLPPVANFSATPTSGCIPVTVQFTDLSENNPIAYIWSFPGGIPSASNQPNPIVAYTQAGVYDVTLTVVNPAGNDTYSVNDLIVIQQPPTALFTSAINGTTVNFTNTSSANATSYLWDFGDGMTSTQANPSHTYTGDGAYVVMLTATNNCGSSTYFQVVTIITAPTAGFSASPTSGCTDLTVQYTNQSSVGVTSWNWSFPGGNPSTSTQQNPTVIYTSPGTFNATLIVTNSFGSDTLTQTNLITADDAPMAGFTSSTNGLEASFT